MSKHKDAALLTGVTGFIGGALAIELLNRTDIDLVCIVRARNSQSASVRLVESLRSAAELYGTTLTELQTRRCRAIPGDITLPFGGVDTDALPPNISTCWHAAASLAFEDSRSEEISLHNVQGTLNIVELGRKLGCSSFNHISTAYVAGSQRGIIPESAVVAGTIPNNHYERSKIAAERIVQDAALETVRIFRPSVVIGHSKTHKTTSFNGLYGFVRGLQRARNLVRNSLGDLLRFRPLRLLADGSTPVNFIPIDYVAANAVKIALSTTTTDIYHLSNKTPPKLAECWGSATEVLGMVPPLFVDDPAEFTLIDQKVDDQMQFYRCYMNDEKRFSVTNSELVLGPDALTCPLNEQDIGRYVGWYLKYLEFAGKSNMPGTVDFWQVAGENCVD